ncbi:hypothetical protein Lepto7375DRAFT_5633 [Leptolyngbya sp. PCC 7375]|nr:hypothetical protein Lepto7375DRAFT_5633 [Leptolyngbya sp. PCC 7375]
MDKVESLQPSLDFQHQITFGQRVTTHKMVGNDTIGYTPLSRADYREIKI